MIQSIDELQMVLKVMILCLKIYRLTEQQQNLKKELHILNISIGLTMQYEILMEVITGLKSVQRIQMQLQVQKKTILPLIT